MNPSVASEKMYFTEMANGGGSPFHPGVRGESSYIEAAQHTNKLLANSTIEEQVHSPTSTTAHELVKKPPGRSRPGTFLNRYCFLCGSMQQHYRDICPASGHTCRCCHKTDHFAGFCQQVAKENGASRPASHTPTPPGPRREYTRLVEQEEHSYTLPVEGIQY